MRDWSRVVDKDLIVYAISRLGFGALPIENWGCYFAPERMAHPDDCVLVNRAFLIWFPTIYDYIAAEPHFEQVCSEARARHLSIELIEELRNTLGAMLRAIASLLTREEQIFVRHLRLQYVHGSLEYFVSERPTVKWYNRESDQIAVEQIPEAVLHYEILAPFQGKKREWQDRLRSRVTASFEWKYLHAFWSNHLTGEHLRELSRRLGISNK